MIVEHDQKELRRSARRNKRKFQDRDGAQKRLRDREYNMRPIPPPIVITEDVEDGLDPTNAFVEAIKEAVKDCLGYDEDEICLYSATPADVAAYLAHQAKKQRIIERRLRQKARHRKAERLQVIEQVMREMPRPDVIGTTQEPADVPNKPLSRDRELEDYKEEAKARLLRYSDDTNGSDSLVEAVAALAEVKRDPALINKFVAGMEASLEASLEDLIN